MATQSATARNSKANSVDTGDLTAQIETLRKDISAITQTVGDLAKSKVANVKHDARTKAAQAQEKGAAMASDAQAQLAELGAEATSYVRRNPVQSLAIAAGLGLMVGFLSRRG